MMNILRSYRHGTVLLGVVGTIAFAACGGTDAPVTPPSNFALADTVFTPGNIFSPPTAEIGVGGTVWWVMTESPEGNGHNAIFSGGSTGAPPNVPVVKDTTVSRTFNSAGTFPYLCTVHPGMVGEVIVR